MLGPVQHTLPTIAAKAFERLDITFDDHVRVGNAATARSTLSSRSRCKVGKGERLVKLATSSSAAPANW